MMAAGAALGAGLSALNASEKIKMEERLMVQRLRNQSILPRAFARPPATPATPALAPAPSTRSLATARAQSSLPPAVLGTSAAALGAHLELLGAHMIGAEVTELIQGYGIAMTLETTEVELMHTIFPHPTLSEMMHESVLSAYGKAIHF